MCIRDRFFFDFSLQSLLRGFARLDFAARKLPLTLSLIHISRACVLREVREETGLTMHAPVYRGIVDFYSAPWPPERMHLFTCTDFSGEMIDCDEGCLEWVDKAAVQDLPIWQGDKIFFKLLAEDAPFFHLELTYEGNVLVKAVLEGENLL